MKLIDKQNIHEKLKTSTKPVLLMFWSYDCMACEMLNSYLLKLSKIYSKKMNFYKIDAQENYDIIRSYNVDVIPTFLFFVGTTIIDKLEKVKKNYDIEKKIRDILAKKIYNFSK